MLVFAVLIIGGYFGYQIMISSVKAAYDLCLEVTLEQVEDSEAKLLSCGAKREVYEELASCVVSAQKINNLNSFLYSPLGYKLKIDTLIGAHNEVCRSSKVDMPGEGIYLEY